MSIRLLEHMRDELIATGIVQNTPEFCRSWLGRSEGYIRVLRYHQIEPSVETLTICSNKLGYYAARLDRSEEKIRIVLVGLRGEESISMLCRRERMAV